MELSLKSTISVILLTLLHKMTFDFQLTLTMMSLQVPIDFMEMHLHVKFGAFVTKCTSHKLSNWQLNSRNHLLQKLNDRKSSYYDQCHTSQQEAQLLLGWPTILPQS